MVIEEIAQTIGPVPSDKIRDIINQSNERKVLYHGIKYIKNVPKILEEGLKPLTPEGGQCSFWATGKSLFIPMMDSPFFHYSGSYNPKQPELTELNLAFTLYDNLQQAGIVLPTYENDSQIRIHETVPKNLFTILQVKFYHVPKVRRANRQTAEIELLDLIKQLLQYPDLLTPIYTSQISF
ncbi:MAG: hypothetical protein ABIF40_01660 [archaeon]